MNILIFKQFMCFFYFNISLRIKNKLNIKKIMKKMTIYIHIIGRMSIGKVEKKEKNIKKLKR